MSKIPNIPNARYTFDFQVFPNLLFGEHSKAMIYALTQEKEEVVARLMNDFYKDFAKHAKYTLTEEDIFSANDFKIIFGRLDSKGTMLLSIDMPMDTCGGIICMKHMIMFNSKELKPRLFTIEKSASSALDFFASLPEDDERRYRTQKNFLCELKSDGKHLNCGYAPEKTEDLLKKLLELY